MHGKKVKEKKTLLYLVFGGGEHLGRGASQGGRCSDFWFPSRLTGRKDRKDKKNGHQTLPALWTPFHMQPGTTAYSVSGGKHVKNLFYGLFSGHIPDV